MVASAKRLIVMVDDSKTYEKYGEGSLGNFIYSMFISHLYAAFWDLKLDSAGSLALRFQEHRTLGRAGRREWPAQCGVFPLWNAELSCAEPGPSSGLGWSQGQGWGRTVLVWGGTDSLVAMGFSAKTSPFDWEAGSYPVSLRNVTGLWIAF